MKKKMNNYMPFVLGTCLLAVVACGSDDDDSGSGTAANPPQQQQETPGTYKATLAPIPLNSTVAGNPTGTLDVVIEGDEFNATMKMTGVPGSMRHAQHIMIGTSCPTASNDVNSDNFIDVLEGVPNYGLILIPLDGNLEDQDDGASGFPFANAAGSYTWTKTASLSRMITDLQDADLDLEDGLGKLDGSDLNLEGKVVLVHGAKQTSNLPSTVATLDDFKNYESLPIACGKIERVAEQQDTAAAATTTTGTTADTTTGTTADTTTGTTADTTTAGATTGATTGDAAATTGATTGAATTGTTTATTGTGTTGTTGATNGTTTVTPTTTGATNGQNKD